VNDRLTTVGLSEAEARRRLAEDGPNLIGGRTRPPGRRGERQSSENGAKSGVYSQKLNQ